MTQESLFSPEMAPAAIACNWRPPETLPVLTGHQHIGFDTETTGKNPFADVPVGVSICIPSDPDPARWKRYYLPHGHRGGGNLDEGLVRRWMKTELVGKDLYGLNTKFDVLVERRWGMMLNEIGCRMHDVAFPAALLNENRRSGFGLAALSQEYLGPEERKIYPSTVKSGEFYLAHAGEIAQRAQQDAYLALRLHYTMEPMIKAEGLDKVLALEDEIIYAVAEMEWNGVIVDRPKLERWRREAKQKYERLILDLWNETHVKISSPDSQPDLKRMFDHLQLEYPRVFEDPRDPSKGYRVSFEEDVLKRIEHPIVQKILMARKVKSLIEKFFNKYLKALGSDNILRYQLHQLRGDENGTVMGRFSSAAPDGGRGGMNCQQVPKVDKQISENFVPEWIVRELFIPDEGYDWGKSDAKQIEYRVLAHYANNKEILQRYKEDPNLSFHKLVETMIHKVKPDFPYWAVKNFNFCGVYGGGRDKMAGMLNITRSELDPLADAYHSILPENKRLMNRASDLAKKRGFVKTYLGRRRRFPTGERTHAALHAVISGTAADIMKMTIRDVYRERNNLPIHKMRMTVHDELDSDIVREEKTCPTLEAFFDQQRADLHVPILWEVKAGRDWSCR